MSLEMLTDDSGSNFVTLDGALRSVLISARN
jgi:hypothetical protein